MGALHGFLARARGVFAAPRHDTELDEEISMHLALETERNIARGMSPESAARQARLVFGPVQAMKEAHRDGRSVRWIDDIVADVRYALRGLIRNPVLAITAILTLAIGIGANTAIYSVVRAEILRPLPFHDAGRLVMLWEENPDRGWHDNVAAPANMLDWKDQAHGFTDVGGYLPYVNAVTMTGAGDPVVVNSYSATGNFFSVLGVRAAIGRTFNAEETWANGTHVAVISDKLWRERFGADRAVLNHSVTLDGAKVQIVGVLPADFSFPGTSVDLWTPVEWQPSSRSKIFFRRAHFVRAVARLAPGVTFADANAQLQLVVRRLQRDYPVTNTHMGAGMTPLQTFLVGNTRTPLLVLLAAVGFLLLIACANVGNLLLVRTIGRAREAALRLALGARRARLLRQALTESLVLAVLGGAAGLALGWWGMRALVLLQPDGLLPIGNININWGVVAFVVGITTLSGVLFGVAPAAWNVQRVPGEVLKGGSRGSSVGPALRRWANALVVTEIALALLLSLGAVLLVRSFAALQQVEPGFDPNGVVAVSLNISGKRYESTPQVTAFFHEMIRRVSAIPGVQSAGAVSSLPLSGGVGWTSDFIAAGRPADGFGTEVGHRSASPDYFRAMHTPVLAGRSFLASDDTTAPNVVIINAAMARTYFHGQNPVGQRITFDRVPDSTSVWRTVVGVVGDQHQVGLATDPQIEFITPDAQTGSSFMNVVARVQGNPQAIVPAIRGVVHDLDATVGITSIETMADMRQQSVARQRFLMTLLSVLAGAGLLMAAIGVYGVMSNLARRRTREMGIRIALGAPTAAVERLVLRDGARLIVMGIGAGLVAAFVANRWLATLLYHVAPTDPLTYTTVPIILAAIALSATWLPALRVGRADPTVALRAE